MKQSGNNYRMKKRKGNCDERGKKSAKTEKKINRKKLSSGRHKGEKERKEDENH